MYHFYVVAARVQLFPLVVSFMLIFKRRINLFFFFGIPCHVFKKIPLRKPNIHTLYIGKLCHVHQRVFQLSKQTTMGHLAQIYLQGYRTGDTACQPVSVIHFFSVASWQGLQSQSLAPQVKAQVQRDKIHIGGCGSTLTQKPCRSQQLTQLLHSTASRVPTRVMLSYKIPYTQESPELWLPTRYLCKMPIRDHFNHMLCCLVTQLTFSLQWFPGEQSQKINPSSDWFLEEKVFCQRTRRTLAARVLAQFNGIAIIFSVLLLIKDDV